MRIPNSAARDRGVAFTLIELLVVIAVIVLLAGMLFPVMGAISVARAKKVAYTELGQVMTAIEAYKSKKGSYPPDNPNGVVTNQLYYELTGSIVYVTNNTEYVYSTLDQTFQTYSNSIWRLFGVRSVNNSSTSARGSDDAPAPEAFLKELRPEQYGVLAGGTTGARVLACSEGWTKPGSAGEGSLAMWRYNSSHPTNNQSTYDLWVDLYIKGRTNRISNWSKEPQILP